MKVYEGDGNGGLVGVTGDRENWVGRYTTESVYVSQGNEIYVLVVGSERSPWRLPDGRLVSLFNTHCTGELRWDEPFSASEDSYRHLAPEALLAAQHFGILPTKLTPQEWQEAIDSYKLQLSDVSEVGVKMLEQASRDRDGTGSYNEEQGKPAAPESRAMYDMRDKGLVLIGGSGSCAGKSTQMFYITDKGRTILKHGAA